MISEFEQEERWFLASVAVDYVALAELVPPQVLNQTEDVPTWDEFWERLHNSDPPAPVTRRKFEKGIRFISFLYNKYGNKFHYTRGIGEPIEKDFDDFIAWLQKMFDEGRYREIDYGVWFDLDEEVIPEEYIPKEMKQ